jgi:histidinol-phosphatase (PHP family)
LGEDECLAQRQTNGYHDPMYKPRLPPDTHVHTYLCKHASGEPAQYIEAALAAGVAALGFTDHVPSPDGYDPANRMNIAEFPLYRDIVRDARLRSPLPIIYGIEADYYEGGMEFLLEWLPRQKFDVILGSVHYISDWPFDNPDHASSWDSVNPADAWRQYFNLLGRLADTRAFDVVGHIDLPKKFGHRIPDALLKEIAGPALDRLAEAGMAIELNTSGLRRPAMEIYPSLFLLSMARERDIPILFGSDSHLPEHVGYEFDRAVTLARESGYTHYAFYRDRRRTMVPLP